MVVETDAALNLRVWELDTRAAEEDKIKGAVQEVGEKIKGASGFGPHPHGQRGGAQTTQEKDKRSSRSAHTSSHASSLSTN
jgi:hypothetical protein